MKQTPIKKFTLNNFEFHQRDASLLLNKVLANKVNDRKVILSLENLLKSKRGFVFKMPKPGTPVVALMSGGLDTTVVIAMLLAYFKLQVYPLVIDRKLPHSKKTQDIIKIFVKYFSNKYPELFHDPFVIGSQIPPLEVNQLICQHENDRQRGKLRQGIPLQPAIYANFAVQYAKYLELKLGVKARSIFGGWLPSNSEWYAYESFQSLRSIMVNLCLVTNDFSWQFTSLPMEKDLGFYFDKAELVKIGTNLGLPLELTWTCYKAGDFQCGTCPPCWNRKSAFKTAKINDPTPYYFTSGGIFSYLKSKFRAVKFFWLSFRSKPDIIP